MAEETIPEYFNNLYYYKVVFELDDAEFIWHNNIFESDEDVSCNFSGKIKLVPITKAEGELLLEDFKENEYGSLDSTIIKSKYIYNSWQAFQVGLSHKPFLLCDGRQQLEKMSMKTALYLAFNIFYGGCAKSFDNQMRQNTYYINGEITAINEQFVSIPEITKKSNMPYYHILSMSHFQSGEIDFIIDGYAKKMEFENKDAFPNTYSWKEKKVYFLAQESFAKTEYVSKFKEMLYFVYMELPLTSLKMDIIEQYRREDRPSSYKYEQLWAPKCVGNTGSSSSGMEEYAESSSGSDGEELEEKNGCVEFPNYQFVYELFYEEYDLAKFEECHVSARYEEDTGHFFDAQGNQIDVAGKILTKDMTCSMVTRNYWPYNYYEVDKVYSIHEFQLFTYYVVGEGMHHFMNFANGKNKELVYPFLSRPETYMNLPVCAEFKYLYPKELEDVYRTEIYECDCFDENNVPKPTLYVEKEKDDNVKSFTFDGGEFIRHN